MNPGQMVSEHDVQLHLATTPLRPSEVIVVLPALDEAQHIAACIRSLMVPHDWMAGTTMVVADGGSRDATREIVKDLAGEFPNLVLIENPGRLQSVAVNTAVEQVACPGHRIMVRCDAHAIYPPRYVQDVAIALRDKGVASVTTPMDAVGRSPVQRATAWIVDTPLGSGGAAHRGGKRSGFVDHGHHAGFDLEWFRRIGGYDGTFSHNEDAEYDMRLTEAGGRIWLEAGIRMAYVTRPTLRGLWRQYWNYGRGRARTVVKHRAVPRLRQMVPVVNVALLSLSAMAGLLWWPAFAWCLLYGAVLVSASVLCTIRLKSADGVLVGPALAAMHLAWGLGFLRQLAVGGELLATPGVKHS
ncbi:glycosyltransferase family 2 protein [Mycolicibacterium baixiangningiae]|uniref:glycosyltransferase family 2 protein n=1 Tax=Mycolicibacterium baixiangningiae TaxID=2761578 RepID=UPI001E4BB74F|nr:glycosyltransferase family 2 protein [Mycolicibacterium baixiangningiae]